MSQSTPFEEYFAVGESVVTAGSGTLFQETAWTPAAICVTDRRILFVPAEGGFVDVPRRQVLSIRSRPTTRRSGRAIGALGLLIGGVALAGIATWSLLTGGSSGAVLALALVAATGAVATSALAIGRVELTDEHVSTSVGAVETALEDLLARADDRIAPRAEFPRDVSVGERREDRLASTVDERPVLRWLAAGLGVLGAGGLVLLGAWTALGATAVALVGGGAAAYGRRYVRALDDRDRRIRRERSVCLYLLDGRTIRFRVDADADIDRELSKLTASEATTRLPGEADTPEHGASTGP